MSDHRSNPAKQLGHASIEQTTNAYEHGDAPALRLPAIAVACTRCGAKPGDLCTSHGGTRLRRHDVHRDRTRAALAQQTAADEEPK